jgi:RNA-binding protein
MVMTGKERAELRSECNRLKPTVHVGQEGFTATLAAALDDALRTRELVKVALNKSVDVRPREAASELAAKVDAEVIQVIGRMVTVYRHNPGLKRKAGAAPPWRA